jgi:luciferase family oxidoreductase group 1
LSADRFPDDVLELQAYFEPAAENQAVQAVPGAGLNVPLWILGSSLFGARLAAGLGLPYAFASHFAPTALLQAIEIYRSEFRPSKQLEQPYVMAGVNVIAANTDQEARRLFTSAQQQFTNLIRGKPGRLRPPIDDIDAYWSPEEAVHASGMLRYAFVGSEATVRSGLQAFVVSAGVDELMVVSAIYEHVSRLRSYELLGNAMLTFCPK